VKKNISCKYRIMMSNSSIFIAVALAFAIIAHPQTFRLVNGLVTSMGGPRVVNNLGVPTTPGLLAHALVAGVVTLIILFLTM
jgi:hypothetical protein